MEPSDLFCVRPMVINVQTDFVPFQSHLILQNNFWSNKYKHTEAEGARAVEGKTLRIILRGTVNIITHSIQHDHISFLSQLIAKLRATE